jgi:predicted SprT family Zn-dependent metalloprotease
MREAEEAEMAVQGSTSMTTTLTRSVIKVPRNIFKGCQRCGGHLVIDRQAEADLRGTVDYVCLQCGRHTPIRAALQRSDARLPAA